MTTHFPKGEGIKIIKNESEAKVPSSIYILPLDKTSATMIIVGRTGSKRKIGVSMPENSANVDMFDSAGNITQHGNVYLKRQVDQKLTAIQTAVSEDINPRLIAIENKNTEQDSAISHESSERTAAYAFLEDKISEETFARYADDEAIKASLNEERLSREQGENNTRNALEKKLDKTTTTVSSPDAVNKYVYLTTEDNSAPKRMLAGDLGKNVANSALTSVANAGLTLGANWSLNANNFGLYFTGLGDKSADSTFNQVLVQNGAGQLAKSNGKPVIEGLLMSLPLNKDAAGNYDAGFNEYLVRNPTTGVIKRSDRPQVQSTFNVPGTISVSYPTKIANSNYTPAPTTPQDIADTFTMIKNLETGYQFTAITPDMLVLRTMDAAKIAPYSTWRVPTDINKTVDAGTIVLKGFNPDSALVSNTSFRAGVSANENSFWTLFINKEFPTDKDWILKMKLFPEPEAENGVILNMRGFYMGFAEAVTATTQSSKQTDLRKYPDSALLYSAGVGKYTTIYFIKKGSKLSAFYYNSLSGNMMVNTIDFDNSMKFFRMATMIENEQGYSRGTLYSTYFTEVAYWIQP